LQQSCRKAKYQPNADPLRFKKLWRLYRYEMNITGLSEVQKYGYVGEYQNKVKPKFSTFLRQHFPCTSPSRF
jgi:hypothetical protein